MTGSQVFWVLVSLIGLGAALIMAPWWGKALTLMIFGLFGYYGTTLGLMFEDLLRRS